MKKIDLTPFFYQKLVIGQVIKKTYNKKVWGSDSQKYMENQKINRKMRRETKNA
ncbi:MAG: hypothetical protein U9P88_00765 [Patescibacteria group bacterium]|nr:hypothetical protein [Patescibacteria group bacterium]